MREYTKHLTDENTRTKGRTITPETAYNAHTRAYQRPEMPNLDDIGNSTREASKRALSVLTRR